MRKVIIVNLGMFVIMMIVAGCSLGQKTARTGTAQNNDASYRFEAKDKTFHIVLPSDLRLSTEVQGLGETPGVGGEYLAEFSSESTTQLLDPVTNTQQQTAVYTLMITKLENRDRRLLPDWINHVSAISDERERTRSDHDGLYGIRQWIWRQSNPMKTSTFSYYAQQENFIWEFRADVNLTDPQSDEFREVREKINNIFANIKFLQAS